jgi:hypothetical protein
MTVKRPFSPTPLGRRKVKRGTPQRSARGIGLQGPVPALSIAGDAASEAPRRPDQTEEGLLGLDGSGAVLDPRTAFLAGRLTPQAPGSRQ